MLFFDILPILGINYHASKSENDRFYLVSRGFHIVYTG